MSIVHNIDFQKASFKDFETIPNLNSFQRSEIFKEFTDYMEVQGHMNYRFVTSSGSGSEMCVNSPYLSESKICVSLVSNDYLNFTQHPKVKATAIVAIEKYGTGAAASPLIGRHHEYQVKLEDKLSRFFNRSKNSSIIYTRGYTANSSTLLARLKTEDCDIVDMAVHASVYETNIKRFPHNSLIHLERALTDTQSKYLTRIVVIDGVYS